MSNYELFVSNSISRHELQYGSINLLRFWQWHSFIFALGQRHCWNSISANIFVLKRNMNINKSAQSGRPGWRHTTNYIVNSVTTDDSLYQHQIYFRKSQPSKSSCVEYYETLLSPVFNLLRRLNFIRSRERESWSLSDLARDVVGAAGERW